MNQADSTIGLSIFNVLSMNPAPMTVNEFLGSQLMILQHGELDENQVARVLDKLTELKRIAKVGDKYERRMSVPLVAFQRDLSDFDAKTGEGGWLGWKVKDPRAPNQSKALEHVLGLNDPVRKARSAPKTRSDVAKRSHKKRVPSKIRTPKPSIEQRTVRIADMNKKVFKKGPRNLTPEEQAKFDELKKIRELGRAGKLTEAQLKKIRSEA